MKFKASEAKAVKLIQLALEQLSITTEKFPETENTPQRIVKMWSREFFRSVDKICDDIFLSKNKDIASGIIHFPNIRFVSCCAHHMLPFSGYAHLLYIPKHYLIGASKPSRIIDFFSRKPQLQETLCNEIVDFFDSNVGPTGTMLVMYARHECMGCRGVKQYQSGMGTSAVRGAFATEKELELKGYELIKISKGML